MTASRSSELATTAAIASLTLPSKLNFEIIVVDDASPDNTAEVAKQLQKAFPGRIILKERTGKLGLGTAYVHGRMWIALESLA
jgi:glycosyltransferase involved in cell wall biosynthesis